MSTKGKKPKEPKKPKPKKKDFHIQIKAAGATVGTSIVCSLSGFEPQTKVAEDEKETFNFKTKKGVPALTEGQVLALDINGQISNVTVGKKMTKVEVTLANGGVSPPV